MINLIFDNFSILSKNFRSKLYIFFIFLSLTIFFESISIILLFHSVNIFFNPADININNNSLFMFFQFLGINIIDKKHLIFSFIVILYLVKTSFLTFSSWWQNSFLQNIRNNIGLRLYKKYMGESHSYHVEKNSSEFIRNITVDKDAFTFSITQSMFLITEVMIVLFITIILIYFQPFVTFLLCSIFLTFSLIWYFLFKKRLTRWGKDRQFYDGKVIKFLNEGFTGHKEIQILGVEKFFVKNFNFNLFKSTRAGLYSSFIQEMPRIWLEFLLIFSFAVIFIFLLVFKDSNTLIVAPLLAAYTGAALRLIPSINRVIVATNYLSFAKPVIKLFKSEFKTSNQENSLNELGNKKIQFSNDIIFKDLNFSYQSSFDKIIRNFNYKIKKNEIIGIIGPSGSGKSTIINLLMGVIAPNQGSILVDGISLDNSNKRSWQDKIGYVPQTIFLTDDSIKKNIALGKENTEINDEKINEVVLDCQLIDFISKLDNKEDARVGELGSKISEGQKQRLGLARVLYKDPDILVLDEFTSSLDSETEDEIMKIINNLKGKKTIFIVSHRDNPIKYCDKVINLDSLNKKN